MPLACKLTPVPRSVFRLHDEPALVQEAKCRKGPIPCCTHQEDLKGASEAMNLRAAWWFQDDRKADSGETFASVSTTGTLVLILATGSELFQGVYKLLGYSYEELDYFDGKCAGLDHIDQIMLGWATLEMSM